MYKKIIILLLISSVLLLARQNPFFPSTKVHQINITSNKIKSYIPLNIASISLPSSARILKKITVQFINIDGSIGAKSISLTNSINWHIPLFISQTYQASHEVIIQDKKAKIIKFNNLVTLYIAKENIKIKTKDINIRHFMMIDPYRIVLDFKHVSDFLSFQKRIKKGIFKLVSIGNHQGYYRIVVQLDGQYKYNFTKISNGYILQCF